VLVLLGALSPDALPVAIFFGCFSVLGFRAFIRRMNQVRKDEKLSDEEGARYLLRYTKYGGRRYFTPDNRPVRTMVRRK